MLTNHEKRAIAYAAIAAKKFGAKASAQPKPLNHVPAGGKAALKDPALSYKVTPPRTKAPVFTTGG